MRADLCWSAKAPPARGADAAFVSNNNHDDAITPLLRGRIFRAERRGNFPREKVRDISGLCGKLRGGDGRDLLQSQCIALRVLAIRIRTSLWMAVARRTFFHPSACR